ncbi:hypothetical protein [Megamonas sp.]
MQKTNSPKRKVKASLRVKWIEPSILGLKKTLAKTKANDLK